MQTLDDVLPAPHFSERHGRSIAAPPAAVWAALQDIRLGDLALSRALMGIRLLPARLAGKKEADRMVSGRILEDGPVPVLAADPDRAVLAGGVMQPWKITGGEEPPELDAAALQAFAEPGWVKVGLDFVLEPSGSGTRLTTDPRNRDGLQDPGALRHLLALHPRRLRPDPARHAPRGRAAGGGKVGPGSTQRLKRCLSDQPKEPRMAVRLNPYISFAGNAREAMEFYEQVFGGTLSLNTFGDYGDKDAPGADKIMHGMLETTSGFTLMGADTPPGMEHDPATTSPSA